MRNIITPFTSAIQVEYPWRYVPCKFSNQSGQRCHLNRLIMGSVCPCSKGCDASLDRRALSLRLLQPRRLEWHEITLPSLGHHDVCIQTLACAISIGSEVPVYRGDPMATEWLPSTDSRITRHAMKGGSYRHRRSFSDVASIPQDYNAGFECSAKNAGFHALDLRDD